MDNEINIWFLLMSLFFPRIVLFLSWITGNLPYNSTPLFLDVITSIFFPRILILIWIHNLQGMSPWFWIHFIVLMGMWIYNMFRFHEAYNK